MPQFSVTSFLFFWSSTEVWQKKRPSSSEGLFLLFGIHLNLGIKNAPVFIKTFSFGLLNLSIKTAPVFVRNFFAFFWSTFGFRWYEQSVVVLRRVARNSQWGGCVWGCGGGAPSRRSPMGVWGGSHRRQGELGAEPPALENFAFFCKITSF